MGHIEMNTRIYGKGSYFRQSLQTSFYIFLQSDLSFTLFFLPFSSTVIFLGEKSFVHH